MRTAALLLLAATLVTLIVPVRPAPAAAAGEKRKEMKGWELYVWEEEKEWVFSLLPGTNRLKTQEEIRRDPVKGTEAIKAKLDELAAGQYVSVRGKSHDQPAPKEPADELVKYGKQIGLKMTAQRE
jgi:hypothetical protein